MATSRSLLPTLLRWLLLTLVLLVLVAGAGAWRAWTGPGPEGPPGQDHALVRIRPGMTLSAAADTLVQRGLLSRGRVLLAGARLKGQDRSLRTGLYRLDYGMSPRDLLDGLLTGLPVQVKVTLPEGLNAGEMADLLAGQMGFRASRFLAIADSLALEAAEERHMLGHGRALADHDSLLCAMDRKGWTAHWCEGYLAPDTYHFAEGSGPEVVAGLLVQTQLARLDSVMVDGGWQNPYLHNPHQLLTLASVVEAEARRDDERARIAAVYTNRLAKGWRLEADPTVAYALGKKGQRLFYKDLEVDSPYNTYRFAGLPPGPIGAPGFLSIQAAARPDTTCRAMFFVSDGQDGHVFSRTAREHEKAVRSFRQLRSHQRRQGSGGS